MTDVPDDVARRMLAKVREFATSELDDDERQVFAQLVAPGVMRAYTEEEVGGFAVSGWDADALPRALADALRTSGVRVVGLDTD
jgi:hypothetical protein